MLLELFNKVNKQDRCSMLQDFLKKGNLDLAAQLVAAGVEGALAKPSQRHKEGTTPLAQAILNLHQPLLEALIKQDEVLNERCLLQMALNVDNLVGAKTLIQAGASLSFEAWELANKNRHMDLVSLMVARSPKTCLGYINKFENTDDFAKQMVKAASGTITRSDLEEYVKSRESLEPLLSIAIAHQHFKLVDSIFYLDPSLLTQARIEQLLCEVDPNVINIFQKYNVSMNFVCKSCGFENLPPLWAVLKLCLIDPEHDNAALIEKLMIYPGVNINQIVESAEMGCGTVNNDTLLSFALHNDLEKTGQPFISDFTQKLLQHPDLNVCMPDNRPFIEALEKRSPLAFAIYQRYRHKKSVVTDIRHFTKQYFDEIASVENTQDLLFVATIAQMAAITNNDAQALLDLFKCIDAAKVKINEEELLKPALESRLVNEDLMALKPVLVFKVAAKTKNWFYVNNLISKNKIPSAEIMHVALLSAIEEGNYAMVQLLLVNKAKANFNKSEALLKAVNSTEPHTVIVKLLLKYGADPLAHARLLPIMAYLQVENTQLTEFVDILKILLQSYLEDEIIEDVIKQLRSNDNRSENVEFLSDLISSSLSSLHQYAFTLAVKEVLVSQYRSQDTKESAMEDSLTRRANEHFRKIIKPAVQAKFDKFGKKPKKMGIFEKEKVEAIEKEIRAFILGEILNNINLDNNAKSIRLKQFIENHKENLIPGDNKDLMKKIRVLTNNEDIAQVAWRAYDRFAPHDPAWENLLTEQSSKRITFTTTASTNKPLSVKAASEVIRTRVAYYFLAEPNRQNFIQQIGDMRRAPDHDNTPTVDSSTCFSGAVGRGGKIFEEHPKWPLPPHRFEIIQKAISSLSYDLFTKKMKMLNTAQQRELLDSLTCLTPRNAHEVIEGSICYEDHWQLFRQQFIAERGTIPPNIKFIHEFEELPIVKALNQELQKNDEGNIEDPIEMLMLQINLEDFVSVGRGIKLGEIFNLYQPQVKEKKSSDEPKPRTPEVIFNPFKLTPNIFQRLPEAALKKALKQYIEYERLFPLFLELGFSPVKAKMLTEAFVRELFSTFHDNSQERIKMAFGEFANHRADDLRA